MIEPRHKIKILFVEDDLSLQKSIAYILEEKGYEWTGGEVSEGWGFASWRNRTDRILKAFFPMKSIKYF